MKTVQILMKSTACK